jgi:hypothetical protein
MLWGAWLVGWLVNFKMNPIIMKLSWALVTHACNPSVLGCWDQEYSGSRPAQADSSGDPHLPNNQNKKMDWGVAQHLLSTHEVLSSNLSPSKKKKKKKMIKSEKSFNTLACSQRWFIPGWELAPLTGLFQVTQGCDSDFWWFTWINQMFKLTLLKKIIIRLGG